MRPVVICHWISFSLIYLAGAFKNLVIPDRMQRSRCGGAAPPDGAKVKPFSG
jgi:hypothetical protein